MYFLLYEEAMFASVRVAKQDLRMTKSELNIYAIIFAIWYHLYNLKNVKNFHGGVLFLVKLPTKACNFTKSNTPWMFFTFLKFYK